MRLLNSFHQFTFGIRSDKGLLLHFWFWFLTVGPVLVAFFLAWYVGIFSLPVELSIEGIGYFYEKGKVLIWLAALSIPLGAAFSRVHSSHQTAASLQLNNERNVEDHWLRIRSDFIEFIDLYEGRSFGVGGSQAAFRSCFVPQPIASYTFFFGGEAAKSGNYNYVLPELFGAISIVGEFLSALSEENREDGVGMLRNRAFVQCAVIVFQLEQRTGGDTTNYTFHSGGSEGVPVLMGDAFSGIKGLIDEVVRVSLSLSGRLFYVSQIASLVSPAYFDALSQSSKFFYSFSEALSKEIYSSSSRVENIPSDRHQIAGNSIDYWNNVAIIKDSWSLCLTSHFLHIIRGLSEKIKH